MFLTRRTTVALASAAAVLSLVGVSAQAGSMAARICPRVSMRGSSGAG